MDWRNPEDYCFFDGLDADGIAWEFVRRNPAYQDAYKKLQTTLAALEADYGPLGSALSRRVRNDPRAFIYTPSKRQAESDSAWRRRCVLTGVPARKAFIRVAVSRQWNMRPPMPDPLAKDVPAPKFLVPLAPWPRVSMVREFIEDSEAYLAGVAEIDSLRLVVINLALSIPKQLKKARITLTEIKEGVQRSLPRSTQRRERRDKYKDYLRILDAVAKGASVKEIGHHIYGDNVPDEYPDFIRSDRVRENIKAAVRMRDVAHEPFSLISSPKGK